MTDHAVQCGMLLVQVLTFGGLVWYCWETRGARKAAQSQVDISQKLISAAMDQVEGLSKPCLTFVTGMRDQQDAILAIGVAGSSIAVPNSEGCFVVENIGNGPALNIHYRFVASEEMKFQLKREGDIRYIQNVLAGKRVQMIEPHQAYNGLFEITFHYESIGGRQYETKIAMHSYVLTSFEFREIKPETN